MTLKGPTKQVMGHILFLGNIVGYISSYILYFDSHIHEDVDVRNDCCEA